MVPIPSLKLLEKETKAVSFLLEACDRRRVAVSFSGGRDSLVALDLAIRTGIERVVFVDTTIDFEENIKFIKDIEDYYGIKIDKVKADLDFFDVVKRVGFPSRRLRWCCDVFKFNPLAEYARSNQIDGFITGLRAEESNKRKTYIVMDNNPLVPSIEINPLLDWPKNLVQEYIEEHELPVNPLYQYVDRLGCWCCPFRTEKEWEQIERNFPELIQKLHKELERFADDIGIKDKANFIKGRKWTRWASPQVKTMIGAYRLCGGDGGTLDIMFFGKNKKLIERVMKLLPILTEDYFLIENRLRVTVDKGKVQRLNTLVEKAINCIGCGGCTATCPEGALKVKDGTIEVDPERCNHCERCLHTRVLVGACVVRNYSPRRRTLGSYY